MAKMRVALAVLLVLALLCIPFAFLSHETSTALTIIGVDARPMGEAYSVNLELSNHLGHAYSAYPVRVEIAGPAGWKECSGGIFGGSVAGDILPRSQGKVRCSIRKQPPGSRLRLVLLCQRARRGLDSFMVRLRLRLTGKAASFSLSLFNKKVVFYTDSTELVSQEFVQP